MGGSKIVFVGLGPNQESWTRGLLKGEDYARRYCARLAVTGAIGRKLAVLGGFPFSICFGGHSRRNLNARWNGKSGKGDKFDKREGRETAARLLLESFSGYVLLGRSAVDSFGFVLAPLETRAVGSKRFLAFPHPSGIVSWWNESANASRARRELRKFLAA